MGKMGFMTVVSVLNDALHSIEGDEQWGKRLVTAIREYPAPRKELRTIPAYSANGRGVFCNAAEVVSQSHADNPQFVVAWGNTAWRITRDPGDGIPEKLLTELRRILRDRSIAAKVASPPSGK